MLNFVVDNLKNYSTMLIYIIFMMWWEKSRNIFDIILIVQKLNHYWWNVQIIYITSMCMNCTELITTVCKLFFYPTTLWRRIPIANQLHFFELVILVPQTYVSIQNLFGSGTGQHLETWQQLTQLQSVASWENLYHFQTWGRLQEEPSSCSLFYFIIALTDAEGELIFFQSWVSLTFSLPPVRTTTFTLEKLCLISLSQWHVSIITQVLWLRRVTVKLLS